MDGLQHPRADQERSEQAEAEGGRDQADVPDLQHAALLLHHHRVQEGGADQPGHERRVLHRVPAPVTAPAELLVGPARAEQQPDPQERPGDQREVARRPDPGGVELAADQRAHAERERDRPQHVARVEHRRVHRHVRVAQQRSEARALGRRRVEMGEGLRLEDHQADEERAQRGQDRRRPGHDLAVPAASHVEDAARGEREHPGPEQQRALLARPHRGQLVEGGRGGRGVVGDQREVEVVSDEGDLEQHHRGGEEARHRVDRTARGVDPAPVAGARAVDRGPDRVQRAQQGGGQQCGAEDRQLDCPGVVVVNFDGHLVIRLSRCPTKVPSSYLPVTITSRPSRKGSGTVPV